VAAQRKGRTGCEAKLIAARALEESVIEQVRSALSGEQAREQLHISETEWLKVLRMCGKKWQEMAVF
jgi:hypothetical protein